MAWMCSFLLGAQEQAGSFGSWLMSQGWRRSYRSLGGAEEGIWDSFHTRAARPGTDSKNRKMEKFPSSLSPQMTRN